MAFLSNPWTYAVVWFLVVGGIGVAFINNTIGLGTFIWLEGAALALGLVALVFRNVHKPVPSVSEILNETEHPHDERAAA